MIPRLPPLLLAVLGGASIYGIKYALDRFEPKAIGPPGSSEHYERVFKYRRNVKRFGIAAAATGIIYGGYLIYETRTHRSSPAVLKNKDELDTENFYQDQYKEREKRLAIEKEEFRRIERERERMAKEHLDKEIMAMEQAIKKNN